MASLVYALNVSLDGFVDHSAFEPPPELFGHFLDEVAALAGSLYGREMYTTMRYWDIDDDGWDEQEHAYAHAWRRQPKWVVSTTLDQVGPNATLINGDLGEAARRIKEQHVGEIEVAGPRLAACLTGLGLIDEYRLYLHPVAVGAGKRYFAGPAPTLRLRSVDELAGGVLRLSYVPR